jgi:phosphatidylserine/phosphatidylglycerophosphate/cardiolipin synthase-like enzyme
VDANANFRDLDIAAVGPVVRDLSKVFDRFWNGEWSVPIAALVDRPYDEADLRDHAQRMRAAIANSGYPHPLDEDVAALTSELATILRALVWAPGHVVFDDPASINDPSLRVIHKLLFQRFDRLQTELLIESAYFIPLDGGVAKLKELVERGVRVRILTNSLASNDVIAAFAGYASSREALIRSGVELHELRPEPGPVRKRLIGLGGKSGLHTKALVFDRKDVFIGSFNLDARSSAINTEAGLYVESPALAAQVVEYMNEGADGISGCHTGCGDDDFLAGEELAHGQRFQPSLPIPLLESFDADGVLIGEVRERRPGSDVVGIRCHPGERERALERRLVQEPSRRSGIAAEHPGELGVVGGPAGFDEVLQDVVVNVLTFASSRHGDLLAGVEIG